MKAILLAGLLVLPPAAHAFAWGQEGHSIVAEIAQRRLDRGTLDKMKSKGLLGGEVSLASLASWADDYRATHRETSGWHFVDIPHDRSTYDPAIDCKVNPTEGDCIINAIARVREALADCSKTTEVRVSALKFLVHFVGDIHQPLHAATRTDPFTGKGDRGGNEVQVTFFGEKKNLHWVWDTGIIMRTVYAWGTYVTRLQVGWLDGRDLSSLQGGTPVEWALEAHRFAQQVAYDYPDGGVLELQYYNKALPVVDRQLALAGVRLARLLQDTLGPTTCEQDR
jgi:hypothetical protein